MEYKRIGSSWFLRIDPGEEILESISTVCTKERIFLASVHGLGALNSFTTGLFDPQAKQFLPSSFDGNYEITSLTGTVTEMGGAPYLHLHMSAADAAGRVVGGHLKRAVVSATAEIVLLPEDGRIGRVFSDSIGLNLFDFQ